MTPEAKVKKKVVEVLKRYNVYYFFPATGGYGKSGVPDIICCYKGRFIAVECKSGNNEPTALQWKNLTAIHDARGVALVINERNIGDIEISLKAV